MKKTEFEKKIKELNIEKIYVKGKQFEYEYSREFYDDDQGNIYGCYYNGHEYIIFFKDLERGTTKEIDKFITEDEAYDGLYEKIVKLAKKMEKAIALLVILPAAIIILLIIYYIVINL